MSTLMFWNKQNAANNQNHETKNGKRNWLHSPDALLNGHVVYLVKFLGNTPVEQAKGIEVVKDAIRRLQFAQQMKKAETGSNQKTKKVEITVSVDGVAVQEPRTQKVLHQFPLHNISYCADEKGVKKFFSFIAKNPQPATTQQNGVNGNSNGYHGSESNEGHECFVFISSKLASDITLTIGQAFDLAYRRYVNDSGKTGELSKVQNENKQLEKTCAAYKLRLKELSELIPKQEIDRMLIRLGIRDLFDVPIENGISENHSNAVNEDNSSSTNDENLLIETSNKHIVPQVPPRNLQNQINSTLDAFKPGGQKLEELLLNSDSDSDFDPRADENEGNINTSGNKISNDLFGFEPSKTFGQQLFSSNNTNNNHNNNNNITLNGINGNVPPTSPPPLLAPPPKASAQRRSAPILNGNTNNNNSGSQDLFGSVPFNPNATSIFDVKIGSDTYKSTTNSKENDFLNPLHNISCNNRSLPSLELNSSAFGDELKNPFNESGIYEQNDSRTSSFSPNFNTALTECDKSDGLIVKSVFTSSVSEPSFASLGSQEKLPGSAFGSASPSSSTLNLSETGNVSIAKIRNNPFAKTAETLLGPRTNYDALRNSPDIESMQLVTEKKKEKLPNYDIFKEAASAAFSELSNTRHGAKQANEFSNKMADVNFKAHNSPSFGSSSVQSNFNPTKKSLVDDFSLESLDPLRK